MANNGIPPFAARGRLLPRPERRRSMNLELPEGGKNCSNRHWTSSNCAGHVVHRNRCLIHGSEHSQDHRTLQS
eukprot:15453377-Alexandrium_andersonii.AAC.1